MADAWPGAARALLLGVFVAPTRALARFKRAWRAQGKTLLLITNSDYQYTDRMMSYCYDRFLPAGMRWRDLFDMVRASPGDSYALRLHPAALAQAARVYVCFCAHACACPQTRTNPFHRESDNT